MDRTFGHLPALIATLSIWGGMAGCGTATRKLAYDAGELRFALHQRLGDDAESVPQPMTLDAEMLRFAEEAVAGERSTKGKVEALVHAILSRAGLSVRYEATTTATAREVFELGQANCISYTNLFIAMARAVGLKAYFVDVTEHSRYLRRAGTIVHVGHICAAVRDGPRLALVDFAESDRLRYVDYRIIDDLEAVAHFIINQGVDYEGLLALPGDHRFQFSLADMEKFRLALRIKPEFAKAHLNLGTAYLHRGESPRAEEHFRSALRNDPDFAPAYTALASLYYSQRRFDEALRLYRQAVSYQKDNPYLRYNLAVTLFIRHEYAGAAHEARRALRHDAAFADAHHLLGVIAQLQGHPAEARKRFQKALELDPAMEDARIRLAYVDDTLQGRVTPLADPSTASPTRHSLR